MCIMGSLYNELRKNAHWSDVYEYSIRNCSDEMQSTVQVNDDSVKDFCKQLEADVKVLTQIRLNGNRLRNRILSFVP